MTPETTNSLSQIGQLGNLGKGTVVSLIVRKKGVARGPSHFQKVYDDDLVHVVLWSGFHYRELAEQSLQNLETLWSSGSLVSDLLTAAKESGCVDATTTDVMLALQELSESLRLASMGQTDMGHSDAEDLLDHEPTTPNVWQSYSVNGTNVIGAKVYVGAGNAADPRAPKPGTVYLDGVKLGESVLSPAANGSWKANQKPKTVIKDILKSRLPSGLYARYSLDPAQLLTIKVGTAASESAKRSGVQINQSAVRSLLKLTA